MVTQEQINKLAYKIIGIAISIHKKLGAGLLESVYKPCFLHELKKAGIQYKTEFKVPVVWDDLQFDTDYRLDILVEDLIVVELKAVEKLLPVHTAQVLTYMRLTQKPKGLLINFSAANIFKDGQKALVNEHFALLPER
jgi:GxxExxY protein